MSRKSLLGGSWAGLVILVTATSVLGRDKPAAIVNGEIVPEADVEAVLAMRPAELFPITDAQQKLIRQEVLEMLISEKLMKQYLAKNAPPINPAEVEQQMTALVESLKSQGRTLADFCKESRQTEAQLRAGVQNMLQYTAYARKAASDEELKKYFNDNLDYFQRTTVRISHIVIRIPMNTPAAEREQAKKRLAEIREQIVGGKMSFADAARQYSQCPSAPMGGDIGVVTRKWMVDEAVARAAFALKKDEISDVVVSEFGVHLIKVTERTEGKKVEFAAVADEVRDSFIEEMRQKLLIDLRRSARVEIK
jgi:parvulin-like peptidyl-prolyl isomerase